MINFIKDTGLVLVLVVLPMAILANNLLGAGMAGVNIKDHFDIDKLKNGLARGGLVYCGILVYAAVSLLMSDMTLSVLGGEYSLVDAMYIVVLATIARYAKEGIEKLVIIMKYESPKEDE